MAAIGRGALENKAAVKPLEVKPLPLKADQYYQSVYPKKYIFLHHTAGGSAASSISGWAANPEHIATPYVIDRDGTIFECFDPKYWAYSLGVKGQTGLEKATIPIEICSYGQLTKTAAGDYIAYTGRKISSEAVVVLDFRGFKYFEAYTTAQIAALKTLLPYLVDRFKITLQENRKNFWEFRDPATLPPGIYSHTTVRKDKIDIFPQKDLIELVSGL